MCIRPILIHTQVQNATKSFMMVVLKANHCMTIKTRRRGRRRQKKRGRMMHAHCLGMLRWNVAYRLCSTCLPRICSNNKELLTSRFFISLLFEKHLLLVLCCSNFWKHIGKSTVFDLDAWRFWLCCKYGNDCHQKMLFLQELSTL